MTIRFHRGDLPDGFEAGTSIAIDTETLGLNPLRDRLCVVQLSAGDGTADVVQIPAGRSVHAPNLARLMADPAVVKLFHFARFDLAVIEHALGVMPGPVWCTKIASRLVRTYTDRHGLKDLTRELLGIDLSQTVKSIALTVENKDEQGVLVSKENWLLLLRGDHELNEVKVSKVPGLKDFRFASEGEILEAYGSKPGYLGPIGTKQPVKVVADRTVANMADFVCGANEEEYHLTGANWGRDVAEPMVADLRNVVEGDASPDGKGVLAIERGIEVGHVFQLGTAYSAAMNCVYLDEKGQPAPMQMGCYGIGVTRILGAAIEQNFDDKGIVWPDAIAPFELVLCPMGYDRSELVKAETDRLYAELQAAGIDVIVDDRGLRPGAMFADWELVGVPHRVVIGERGLKEGNLEYQGRRDAEASAVPAAEMVAFVKGKLGK